MVYRIFRFIYSNTVTCLATNLWHYLGLCASLIIVRVSFGSCGHVCFP